MYAVAFTILLVTQMLDVQFTKLFLENGGREYNPMADLVIVQLGWAALLLMKMLPALIGIYNADRWQQAARDRGGLTLALANTAVYGMTTFYVLMICFYTWIVANGYHT